MAEILLTDKLMSLVAVDLNGQDLQLNNEQSTKIKEVIKVKCPTCKLCPGVGSVNAEGYVHSYPSASVPASCPANGTVITV